MPPRDIGSLFERTVPPSLIQCIRDMLRYDPSRRLTPRQCLNHQYLRESLPRNNIPLPPALRVQTLPGSESQGSQRTMPSRPTAPPVQNPWPSSTDYPMDVSPSNSYDNMEVVQPEVQPNAKPKFGFGKKPKWNIFASDKSQQLPPVQEIPPASGHLKRPQSSGSLSHRGSTPPIDVKKSNKKEAERLQREAEIQRRTLAEKMNRDRARAVMQKRSQIISRTSGNTELEWRGTEQMHLPESLQSSAAKGKQAATGPIRKGTSQSGLNGSSSRTTVHAASGRFASPEASSSRGDWHLDDRATKKARTRDHDDDYSIDSSSIQSSRMSTLSFATVDSDPGPSRIRNRPSIFGLNRMQSSSSLRTSFDDFSPSARSSNSMSLEGQLARDFRNQASFNTPSPMSGSVSPPPIHSLSLSPTLSPALSPSPTWMPVPQQQHHPQQDQQDQLPPYINMPHPQQQQKRLYSPFDFNGRGASAGSYNNPPSPYRPSPSTAHSQKSDINPIFSVVSYNWDSTSAEGGLKPNDHFGASVQPSLHSHRHPPSSSATDEDDYDENISVISSPTSLPPFSELDAFADGASIGGSSYDYPPSPLEQRR